MAVIARPMPRLGLGSARRRPLLASVLVSLVLFLSAAAVAYASINPTWAAESLNAADGTSNGLTYGSSVWKILLRNLGAIMLLYSGVLTLGVSTVLGLIFLSMFVGATVAVVVTNVGAWQLLADVGAYAPVEFLGCIVAAAAGLYPLFAVIGQILGADGRRGIGKAYLDALGVSLKIFGGAVLLILVAAGIEATLIAIG